MQIKKVKRGDNMTKFGVVRCGQVWSGSAWQGFLNIRSKYYVPQTNL